MDILEGENWKYIPMSFKYEVSDEGRVRNLETEEVLQPDMSIGRPRVWLYMGGKRKHFYIATLVGKAFIPNPENLPVVRRIDPTLDDYSVANLCWGKPGRPKKS